MLCLSSYYVFYPSIYIGGDIKVEKLSYSKSLLFVYVTKPRGVGGLFSSIATETNLIWGADPFSFEYLGDALAKDKNYVYLGTNKFENKPPKTLKAIPSPKIREDNMLYVRYYIIGNVLIRVGKHTPKTYGSQVDIGRLGISYDSNGNIEKELLFDYDSTIILPCNYIKDKNGVYYTGSHPFIIENADSESFSSDEDCEARDKNFSYYLDKGQVKRRPLEK